tara:strand:- start:3905 stop:4732 length:828 start_codon:yes stop_codon:yes gene_type:complete
MSKVHTVLLAPEDGDPHGLLEGRPYGARPPIAHRWHKETGIKPFVTPWRFQWPQPTASLGLGTRALNSLGNVHINWLDQLLPKTDEELLRLKNMGRHSLRNLKEVLEDQGLSTGMRLERALVLAWDGERDTEGCTALAEVMARGKARHWLPSITIGIRDLLAYTDGRPFTGRDYGTLVLLDAEGHDAEPPPPKPPVVPKSALRHLQLEGTEDMAACGKKVEDRGSLRHIEGYVSCPKCLESEVYEQYRAEWRAWKKYNRLRDHQDELRKTFTYGT